MARICPNCSSVMVVEMAQGVSLDVCPNCAGLWLSPAELKALVTGSPERIAELEAKHQEQIEQHHVGSSHLMCPDDHVLMEQYHYLYDSPVPIHTCSHCGGMFITADELPQMQQLYRQSHLPPSHDEELRISMGLDIAAHQQFMIRQRHLQGLFDTFRRYSPGWGGFFP